MGMVVRTSRRRESVEELMSQLSPEALERVREEVRIRAMVEANLKSSSKMDRDSYRRLMKGGS